MTVSAMAQAISKLIDKAFANTLVSGLNTVEDLLVTPAQVSVYNPATGEASTQGQTFTTQAIVANEEVKSEGGLVRSGAISVYFKAGSLGGLNHQTLRGATLKRADDSAYTIDVPVEPIMFNGTPLLYKATANAL
jgi:hypothetical protein